MTIFARKFSRVGIVFLVSFCLSHFSAVAQSLDGIYACDGNWLCVNSCNRLSHSECFGFTINNFSRCVNLISDCLSGGLCFPMTVIICSISVAVSFHWIINWWSECFNCSDCLCLFMSIVYLSYNLCLRKWNWARRGHCYSPKLALNDWVAINNNCSCVRFLTLLSYNIWSNNFFSHNCSCGFICPRWGDGLCFSLNLINGSNCECFCVCYSFCFTIRIELNRISLNIYWWNNCDSSCFNYISWMVGPWWSDDFSVR